MDEEKILAARFRARLIGDHASVAFWMKAHSAGNAEYHLWEMDSEFQKLADTLGYDITKREESELEAAE